MSKPKLYIPDQKEYFWPFASIYDLTDDVRKADTIMLTGGQDVSPWYYNERKGCYTHPAPQRDLAERELFEYGLARKIPFLGICRGAQFLCVMAGGKLAQHIHGHVGPDHIIYTNEGRKHIMSSSHHQMMLPQGVEHELIAWAKGIAPYYLDGNDENHPIPSGVEPEIAFFPKIEALAIQGHPEYLEPGHSTIHYVNRLVRERLL